MCKGVSPAWMFMHHICAWCMLRPEEGIRYPRVRVTEGWELPCGYWESN